MSKLAGYAQVVTARKACHLCAGLTNPADVEGGRFDSEHVGAWSLWQGNLDASLMVVGQDWGDETYFIRREGREGPRNPTNLALVELVGIAGISIGEPGSSVGRDIAFFTNAILCLKGSDGGLQGKVQASWFDNCAQFLRRQIEIVRLWLPIIRSRRIPGLARCFWKTLGFGRNALVRLSTSRAVVDGPGRDRRLFRRPQVGLVSV